MPDLRVVRAMGSTDELLRSIFTARAATDNTAGPSATPEMIERTKELADIRDRWERRIQNRVTGHVDFALKNHNIYTAIDVAWDSPPITKSLLPLMLYAQGRLDHKKCLSSLESAVGKARCNDFKRKNEKGEDVVDLPKFVETHINLVRSFVTRRLAAQDAKYANLYPYYKYEARGNRQIDQLRADALSQRVDIMADDFGYRHHDTQLIRNALLYAHTVDFVANKWDVRKSVTAYEVEGTSKQGKPTQKIERQGISWTTPHPLRVFHDTSAPLSAINTGDMDYIGYWDIVPYRHVRHNRNFYNRDNITYGEGFDRYFETYTDYFNQYHTAIKRPGPPSEISASAVDNDRKENVGQYHADVGDAGVLLVNYFEQVIPSDVGFGGYTEPIWVRFIVGGERTILFAEFLPSTPAVYLGYNEKDDRQVSISFAHEVLIFQDQMSNLLTQMLDVARSDQLKIYGIDLDFFDKDQAKEIRAKIDGDGWDMQSLAVSFSRSRMKELGVDVTSPVTITQPSSDARSTQVLFDAMVTLIQVAERVTAMSANEVGQPIVRGNGGVTATEADQISQTTNNVHGFLSNAIDDCRSAKKRIIWESMISEYEGDFEVPVLGRYPESVIKKAGFKLSDGSDLSVGRAMIVGTINNLKHSYIFTSRDGSERANNVNAAQTLIQLFNVLKDPVILQAVGKSKFYEMLNTTVRMLDVGLDLNLEVRDGDENFNIGQPDAEETIGKLAQIAQQNSDRLLQLEEVIQQLQERLAP